nr:condensation domain-containing protein [Actinomycetota bacterium]
AAPPAEADGEARELLASLWCEVLDLPEVAPTDDFFDLGGDSLLAMRVIAKAGAAGLRIDSEAFFANPTLAAVAASATREDLAGAEQGAVTGELPLTPSQLWFFEEDFEDAHHWNGFWPLLSVPERMDPVLLGAALHRVLLHHDALRVRFRRESGGWRAEVRGPETASPVPFSHVDMSELDDEAAKEAVQAAVARLQGELDLVDGPPLKLTYFDLGPGRPGRLHLAANWVVLDYYSSRVFFEDLLSAYEQLRDGSEPALPPKTTSMIEYGRRLIERARDADVREELPLWTAEEQRSVPELPVDHEGGRNDQASARQLLVLMDPDDTEAIVQDLPRECECDVSEALLAAIGRAVSRWSGIDSLMAETEAHGRWGFVEGADVSRTVGRCSTFTPVHLRVSHEDDPRATLESVVEQVGRYPRHGVGHGLLRYLGDDEARRTLAEMPRPSINVNYWGRANEYLDDAIWPFEESPGPLQSPRGLRPRVLDVFALVLYGQLGIVWIYSENLHREETVAALAEDAATELLLMAGRDPSDGAPLAAVPIDDLAAALA